MSDNIYVIYKHTCIITGKSYIGQTGDLDTRTKVHQSPHSGCTVFHAAIMKYGWENFTTEILHSNITLDEANTLEKQLIAECNTIVPNGYNLMSGGNNSLHSEDTKQKMSASKRGKSRGSHSEETKIKISEAAKHMKAETKAKLSAAKKGSNNPNFGKPGTMLGRKQTPESIAKRIAARKAKT